VGTTTNFTCSVRKGACDFVAKDEAASQDAVLAAGL
jgi:hypothetical protein